MIQHCRKTLHSRTKENHSGSQIQKALWRKSKPLFSHNKKLYASKEVKGNAVPSEGKSYRPDTKVTVNQYVSWPLSVKQEAKITFAQWKCSTFQDIPNRGKNLPPPFITIKPAAQWTIECEIRRRCWRIHSRETADVFSVVTSAGETRN